MSSIPLFVSSALSGEVSPVLARWALCQVPVLRGRPHGWVQHASVHPPGVQSYGRQSEFKTCPRVVCCVQTAVYHHTSRLLFLLLFPIPSALSEGSCAKHVLSTWGVCRLACVLCVNVCVTTGQHLSTGSPELLIRPCCLQNTLTDIRVCVLVFLCTCVPVTDNSSQACPALTPHWQLLYWSPLKGSQRGCAEEKRCNCLLSGWQ